MKSRVIRDILDNSNLDIPSGLAEYLRNNTEAAMINGIGGEDAWYNFLIPKSIRGIDLTAPGILHDWKFYKGATLADFLRANRQFLYDIIYVIDSDCLDNDRSLDYIQECHAGAWKFFTAVDKHGIRFFKMDKDAYLIDAELKRMKKLLEDEIDARTKLGEGDMY